MDLKRQDGVVNKNAESTVDTCEVLSPSPNVPVAAGSLDKETDKSLTKSLRQREETLKPHAQSKSETK